MSRRSVVDNPANRPATVTVGVESVIFSVDADQAQLLVLLARHQEGDRLQWGLPRTLVCGDESLEAAAYRTLREKIRADNLYLEQLYTFDGDAATPGEERYLSVSYFALVRYTEAALVADPHTKWHPVAQTAQLAFDHNRILAYGYQRLRNKLEYSPIAFEVLPERFTLGELYQLYCTVLGEQFSDYSNFRARLLKLGFLTDTGLKLSRGAGRPATLYRFDADKFAPLKDKPLVFV
ncbi:MAG: NUDIX domain-containing protein [Cyanobacteria bacterium P01_A01_bin.135]